MSMGLYAIASADDETRGRMSPLLQDMGTFPYSEVQDAVMALWFAEGEMRGLIQPRLDAEAIIEGRALPPRIARRVRGGAQRSDFSTTPRHR